MKKNRRIWITLLGLLMSIVACDKEENKLFDEHGQIPPGNELPGNYTGELEFWQDTSLLSFSRARGSISEARDLIILIVDPVLPDMDTIEEVQPASIAGILTSTGEFWGKLLLADDSELELHATAIPDTLKDDAIRIAFTLEPPFGTENIDSIACLLNKN